MANKCAKKQRILSLKGTKNKFSDAIWWTKKSRIEAANRLSKYNFHSELILVWYALFSVSFSIYKLSHEPYHKDEISLFIIFSVLTLCASIYVNGRSFTKRSMLVTQSFEMLGKIEQKAKKEEKQYGSANQDTIDEYHNAISISENHHDIDYKAQQLKMFLSGNAVSPPPNIITALSVIYHKLFFYAFILGLYILPVALLLFNQKITGND